MRFRCRLAWVAFPLLLHPADVGAEIVINELMSVNDDTVADENGEYDDWIEIANAGSSPIGLAGYRIGGFRTDNPRLRSEAWSLPSVVLHPAGRLIVWADGDTAQGPFHGSFRLSGAGETVVLWDPAGAVADSVVFGPLDADRSFARSPDMTGKWALAGRSSPGEPNHESPWELSNLFSTSGALVVLLALLVVVVILVRSSGLLDTAQRSETHEEVGRLAGSIDSMAEALNRATAALGRERERLGTIVEGMLEGVVALDEADQVTLTNSRFQQYLGLANSPTGMALADCAPVPELLAVVADARKQGMGDETEGLVAARVEFDLPGQTSRRVLARAVPIRDTGGVVVVIRDLTELRHLESIRRDFVANVSHELRTPVSVIRANAETLVDGALDDRDDAEVFAEAILSNAERLSALIADLLDLSRLEAGSYRLDRGVVHVDDIANRVIELCSERAAARGIECRAEVPSGTVVMGDARSVEQILFNLVDNAVKYNAEGGRVFVQAVRSGGSVRLSVEDDGAGVAEEHRSRVFERFYRVDPGRSRDLGGTGLGLAIVKHLAESMGGKVGVEAVDPKGVAFWVDLPAVS